MSKKNSLILTSCLIIINLYVVWRIVSNNLNQSISISPYPNGLNFAFTITDDPDSSTVQSVRVVYDLLYDLGFRTTIAVWVKEVKDTEGLIDGDLLLYEGETCENPEYTEYIKSLQDKGFEISLHTISGGHDLRQETIDGYEKFKEIFGQYPKINIMHSKNKENIYWGKNVFKNNTMQRIVSLYAKMPFSGEDVNSPYFWGDICKEKTKYIRMWGTSDINTLKFNPSMPYHDSNKPYVNYWFSFSEAHTGDVFNEFLSDRNIDKLIKERGACIAYTHFGSNFVRKNSSGNYIFREDVKKQFIKLSQHKDGWFVPASELLDRLLAMKNINITDTDNALIVTNANMFSIEGVTLLNKPNQKFYDIRGNGYDTDSEGEIIIKEIPASGAVVLYKYKNKLVISNNVPGKLENFFLIYERMKVMIMTRILAFKENYF